MRCILLISFASILWLGLGDAEDSPGFFLKITKNVPRLGKRSDKDFGHGLWGNYKSVPRMGRSVLSDNELNTLVHWLKQIKSMKSVGKRVLMSPQLSLLASENELSVVQPVNSNTLRELLNKNAIPRDNVKFVHWKDFDRALQLDAELYGKVSSLGLKPDQLLKQGISVGNYIPLMENAVDADGTDYALYTRDGGFDGPYASEFLRYNSY
ncbi:uncharacterized protein LOC133338127 [Musca vetustissima]|uniref:uncharacterized protein LOC133338127 n=1 Tax=Musca vetustissima TaxID=27455 RepID=UPI002AB76B46|nr:uncharacterized protein LOC133338127 [Musca vetustissima]